MADTDTDNLNPIHIAQLGPLLAWTGATSLQYIKNAGGEQYRLMRDGKVLVLDVVSSPDGAALTVTVEGQPGYEVTVLPKLTNEQCGLTADGEGYQVPQDPAITRAILLSNLKHTWEGRNKGIFAQLTDLTAKTLASLEERRSSLVPPAFELVVVATTPPVCRLAVKGPEPFATTACRVIQLGKFALNDPKDFDSLPEKAVDVLWAEASTFAVAENAKVVAYVPFVLLLAGPGSDFISRGSFVKVA